MLKVSIGYRETIVSFMAFFLVLVPPCLANERWTLVKKTSDYSGFIDKTSIQKSGNIIDIWVLRNIPLGEKSPDGVILFKSSKTLESFDCNSKTSKTVEFLWFSGEMGSGRTLYSDKGHKYPWAPYDAGSFFDNIAKVVCSR